MMLRGFWVSVASVLCATLAAGCASAPRQGAGATGQAAKPSNPYKYEVYFVCRGDTADSIARKFGVSWERIGAENKCGSNDLKLGQVLLIPLFPEDASLPRRTPAMPALPASAAAPGIRAVSLESLHRGKPGSAFWWPTAGNLTWRYGDVVRGFQEPGIGLSAPVGTEVRAVAAGAVICCVHVQPGWDRGWGNVVAIRHGGGVVSWYGHLDQILVREGQKVEKGERIGAVGSSGAAVQPELALRFFRDERPVDPLKYLP